MSRILTLEEAREATSPHHDLWTATTVEAWAEWRAFQTDPKFASVAQAFDSAARFHFLNRIISSRIEAETDAIRFNVGGAGLLLQPVADTAFVRFKHLNGSDLRPRAYATNQQVALRHQLYVDPLAKQLVLEGFSEARVLLTQGYTLNQGEDDLDKIVVVCHIPEFRFYYDVRGDDQAEVMMFPGLEPQPPRLYSTLIPDSVPETDAPEQ